MLHRLFCALLALGAVVGAEPATASAPTPRDDGETLLAACRRHARSLELVGGGSHYYGGGVEDARRARTELETVEGRVFMEVLPLLNRFVESYGEKGDEINATFRRLGVRLDRDVGGCFDELHRGLARLRASRAASAQQVLQRARMDLGNLELFTPERRVRELEEIRVLLMVGQQLDPTSQGIHRMLASIDGVVEVLGGAAKAGTADTRSVGDFADFAGPGRVRDLAAAVLRFLRSHPDWGGAPTPGIEVLSVAVCGNWGGADTDLLGRTVAWRLPVRVALAAPELDGMGLVRVCELAVVTRRREPGSPPAPPFEGYRFVRSWLVRAGRF